MLMLTIAVSVLYSIFWGVGVEGRILGEGGVAGLVGFSQSNGDQHSCPPSY